MKHKYIKSEKYNKIIKSLKSYRYTSKRIEILEKINSELSEYKTRGIKQVCTDGINVTACGVSDTVGTEIVKIDVMINKVNNELLNKSNEKNILDKAMSALEDDERDIIEMKFIDKIPTKLIEVSLGYERTQLNRKKNSALEHMYAIICG